MQVALPRQPRRSRLPRVSVERPREEHAMPGTLTPVRVVLAEDEVLVREGIRRLFETIDSIEVVEAVEDLTSLWAAVEAHDPDVVVTVVPMAPTFTDEGIRFAVELRQLR